MLNLCYFLPAHKRAKSHSIQPMGQLKIHSYHSCLNLDIKNRKQSDKNYSSHACLKALYTKQVTIKAIKMELLKFGLSMWIVDSFIKSLTAM